MIQPCPLDGEMKRVRDLVMEPECDAATCQRGFAILVGAAAGAAARFDDDIDLGGMLTEAERAEWGALCHLLMRMADRYTLASPYETGELGGALENLRQHLIADAGHEPGNGERPDPLIDRLWELFEDDPPEEEG